jgi:hypothetical protein
VEVGHRRLLGGLGFMADEQGELDPGVFLSMNVDEARSLGLRCPGA